MDIELNLTTETVDHAGPAEPMCVEPDAPLATVFELLKQRSAPSVLVCRDGKLIGIFTERDALRLMARGQDLSAPVERFMARDPMTIRASDKVADAIRKMSAGGYRRLPVVDASGAPTGVIQVSAIVHYLVEHFPKTIYNQPPVARHVMQNREGS